MAHNNHSHSSHETSFQTYIKVFATLIILTIITVAVSQINLGIMNTFVAMLIATVKAAIVILWFMHMKEEGKLNRVVFASAFVFAFIFYILTAMDVFTRKNLQNLFINN